MAAIQTSWHLKTGMIRDILEVALYSKYCANQDAGNSADAIGFVSTDANGGMKSRRHGGPMTGI